MPDKFLLRRKLFEQLGRRRYIKFVKSLPSTLRAWRMLYWQQEAWGVFCEANPELAASERDLPYLLRHCLTHGCDLELFPVRAIWWNVDYAPRSDDFHIRFDLPPPVIMTGERAKTEPIVPYWACPKCVEKPPPDCFHVVGCAR